MLSRILEEAQLNLITVLSLLDVNIIETKIQAHAKFKGIYNCVVQDPNCIPRYIVRQGRSYTVRQGRSSRLSSSPKNLKFGFTILHTFHDSVIEGHLGHLRTYKCIATELFWEVMRNDIRKYVDQCPSCQQNKIQALSSAGLLQPLPILDRIWEDISVDFVEGLLRSKGFDTVLVVVDRLSKYAHFLPLRHPFSAKTVAMMWSGKLAWVEYWYNRTHHTSIKTTPYAVVYGWPPPPIIFGRLGLSKDSTGRCEELLHKFFPYEILGRVGEVAYLFDLRALAKDSSSFSCFSIEEGSVFHVSQLKKAVGEKCPMQPDISLLNDQLEYFSEGDWECLVSWNNQPHPEATWEAYAVPATQFPDFHLEDKVSLLHGWMVDESELRVIHYTLGPLKPWDWWTSWLLKPVDIWQNVRERLQDSLPGTGGGRNPNDDLIVKILVLLPLVALTFCSYQSCLQTRWYSNTSWRSLLCDQARHLYYKIKSVGTINYTGLSTLNAVNLNHQACFLSVLLVSIYSKIPVFLGGISIFVCFLSAAISLALAFAIVPRQVMPWTGLLLMYEWIFTIFILLFGSYLHFIFKWGKSMATQAGSFSDSESFDYSAKDHQWQASSSDVTTWFYGLGMAFLVVIAPTLPCILGVTALFLSIGLHFLVMQNKLGYEY
ncbi:inositol phosphorylceramide glucuronosyltransferase 1 [Cucumis melo var. makuwa]|uniref:Inositol phosphorylceramide glucuronosyltransferase 1 n=1 Tax=Cucumis melo var. makuwa TaxID=1194695 RepID=A0A5D3DU05_CUCMM|nr:inositol phosphorylceramide glucuronosyltransferase 1 [Cucumis melo var. makuwa]